MEDNSSREVDMSNSKEGEEGSTEISLDMKDALGLSNEPDYLSFTDG